MQSTVFDFSFNLKNVDTLKYILPSRYQVFSIDFKTITLKEPSRDFGLSSLIRMRNSGPIVYTDIYEYCDINIVECNKERSYLGGKHSYQDMFRLEASTGFNYSPEYLIRDSNFLDMFIGRGIDNKGFFSNQTLFLVRGHKYIKAMNIDYVRTTHDRDIPIPMLTSVELADYRVLLQPLADDVSVSDFSNFVYISNQYCMEIIENDTYDPVLQYGVRADIEFDSVATIDVHIDDFGTNLESVYQKGEMLLSVVNILFTDLLSLTMKYGIISLNTESDLKEYYSPNSRYIYLEG